MSIGCPSLGQRSKKAPGAKWQGPKLPKVRCSKTPRDCRALWSSPSPSPGMAQAFSALLAGPLVQRRSQTGPWPSRNHIRALELVRQQPASCQTGFQELEPWLWKSDLTFFFVSSSLQIFLNLLHFTETELALTCYSVVLSAYRWGSHFGIGAYIWGGRKPTAATGASHVVHSLTGSADRDTFLHNHPSVLCQMPQEPALG